MDKCSKILLLCKSEHDKYIDIYYYAILQSRKIIIIIIIIFQPSYNFMLTARYKLLFLFGACNAE